MLSIIEGLYVIDLCNIIVRVFRITYSDHQLIYVAVGGSITIFALNFYYLTNPKLDWNATVIKNRFCLPIFFGLPIAWFYGPWLYHGVLDAITRYEGPT